MHQLVKKTMIIVKMHGMYVKKTGPDVLAAIDHVYSIVFGKLSGFA